MTHAAQAFLPPGLDGDASRLLAARDWGDFPRGDPAQWPEIAIRSIRTMMAARTPLCFLWGPELLYFYNDAYVAYLGDKHPAALARPFWEAWPEVRATFEPFMARALAGEICMAEDMEFRVMRHGALQQAFFTFMLMPVFDEAGRVLGLHNSGFETTHRVLFGGRQAFQLQLGERLRAIVEPDEVIARACELLGQRIGAGRVLYAEVEHSGESINMRRDWVRRDVRPLANSVLRLDDFGPRIADATRHGEVVVVGDVALDDRSSPYAQAYLANGVRAFVGIPLMKAGRLRALLNVHDAGPRGWTNEAVALCQDMVDRTWSAVEQARAQAELRVERDESRSIFDGMAEGFAVVDDDWVVTRVNAEAMRISQHRAEDVVGRNHWDVWPDLLGTPLEVLYRRVKATRVPDLAEMPYTFPSGDAGWLEVRATPIQHGGLAFFFRNITRRRAAQERLQEADRRKDEFLAMLAHELRNPLAPIGAAADLLQLPDVDAERIRRTSRTIARQVRHMTTLVDDLLDVSRVTRGLVTLRTRPIDMRQVVNEAIEQAMPLIRARGHHVELHLAPEATTVLGDRERLVQVVVNLLNNAAKYTHDGGHLGLRTEARDAHVVVSVTDDGIGMPPDLLPRVFDLFTQAERSSDRSSGGLGLGLALARSLVELHHGSVACHSAGLGRGSTFTISLPRLAGAAASDAPEGGAAAPSARRTPLKILVVDDNADAAEMLALLLGADGHDVLIEHGSRSALERARRERPDVCLLDIGLPEMDGNELARRLRAEPGLSNVRLVAITGYGQESDREQSRNAGFDHHFVKPVDMAGLHEVLSRARAS